MGKGSGRVTMQDVADVAGVTARTVSNVVNDYPFVREETRKRVWEAIDKLGYTMNLSARGLKQGKAGLIALALPDLTMPYFADLANAVITQAQSHGMSVIIEPTLSSPTTERQALRRVRGQLADGVIYCPLEINPEELDRMDLGIPVVVLAQCEGRPKYDHVMIRNTDAAQAATDLLIRGGSRRIVALGLGAGQKVGPSAQRFLGYRQALAAHGLQPDPDLEVVTRAWHRSDGFRAINDLCERGIRFDGVFGFTDQVAAGAMTALQIRGLSIPGDVAVIGFDDNDESQYLIPSLSTVDPGIEQIAEYAVEGLVRRLSSQTDFPRKVVEVDFRLVERQSTRKVS